MLTFQNKDVKDHWNKHKYKYQNNPHIPSKWKSGKHYIYYRKIKTKGWYFVCDIESNELTVLAACNESALTRYANRKYGKLKESYVESMTLQQYLYESISLGLL